MAELIRTYDMLEPSDDPDRSIAKLTDVFAPLYTASWVAEKAKFYGDPPYNMNVATFIAMWMNKALRIFIGYREMKPAGYVLGILFRPFTHDRRVFQIDDWYAPDDPELLTGMFDNMQTAMRFIGIDEIHVNVAPYANMPALGPQWKEARQVRTVHFVKR